MVLKLELIKKISRKALWFSINKSLVVTFIFYKSQLKSLHN